MDKTIEEWFEYLPNDIKQKAINNIEKGNNISNRSVKSLEQAIDASFNWKGTDEGHDYWREISNNAYKGQYNRKPIMGIKKKLEL